MSNEKRITTPFTEDMAKELKAGDIVLISGVIYTGRDAAHKRLVEAVKEGKELPFDVKDQIIYYVGPTPTKPGHTFGSAGPTTSYRMDAYSPTLIELGLRGMIGKGYRGQEVKESIKKNHGVYFAAIGGLGATIGKSVTESEIIAYEDLGAEAIRKITVKDFPVTVIIDCEGNDLYEMGQQEYLKWRDENESK